MGKLSTFLSVLSMLKKHFFSEAIGGQDPPAPPSAYAPADNQFQGSAKYTGWEKFAIFDRNRRLSPKRYEIGPWLLFNAYRKSYALYRMMAFSMTFTDPYPGFKVTAFICGISQKLFDPWLTDKLLLNSNRKPQ